MDSCGTFCLVTTAQSAANMSGQQMQPESKLCIQLCRNIRSFFKPSEWSC